MISLKPGTRLLDRYELRARIGAGGFGEVWEAVGPDGSVAIKFLRAAEGADALRRFQLEARVLSRFSHPNCVAIVESGRTPDGLAFIVMELLRGQTLTNWAATPRSVEEIVDVGAQIAEVLGAAHRHGLIHRDLKPPNIMVVGSGAELRVKVLDFGLAKMLGVKQQDITKTGEIHGTPGYMSPEQLRGLKSIGPATDLYGLGLVLYWLLEGRQPFEGKTPLEIGMNHLTEPVPPMRRRMDPWLRALVNDLLEKDPARRPGGAAFVARVLAARGVLVTEPTEEAPEERPIAAIAMVVVVVVVAVAALAWWQAEPDEPKLPPRSRLQVTTSQPANPVPAPVVSPEVDREVDMGVLGSLGCGRAFEGVGNRQTLKFRVGFEETEPIRTYVPPDYEPDEPHGLMVLLHEARQSPDDLMDEVALEDFALGQDFILATPDASNVNNQNPWKYFPKGSDGVGWALDLAYGLCVDFDRVVVLSHGGLAGRALSELACTPGHVDYAIATSYRPSKSESAVCPRAIVPFLLLAPTEDANDPVDGIRRCASADKVSLEDYEFQLRQQHGCTGDRSVWKNYGAAGTCYTWTCDVPLVSCHTDGGRHWPGVREDRRTHCDGPIGEFPHDDAIADFLMRTPPSARDRDD